MDILPNFKQKSRALFICMRAPQRKTGANPSGSSWRAEGAKRVDGLTDRVSREGGREEGRKGVMAD